MCGCGKENSNLVSPKELKVPVASPTQVIPAENDLKKVHYFGEKVVLPRLLKLRNGEHYVPAVQKVAKDLRERIIKRFGTDKLDLVFTERQDPNTPRVAMGSRVSPEGVPYIEVVIPFLLSTYEEWLKLGAPLELVDQVFDNMVTAAFLHECFHLTDTSDLALTQSVSREDMIKEEAKVIALTCEHVILPLSQANTPLCDSDKEYLQEWLKLKDSPEKWLESVSKEYTGLYVK